MFTGIISDLGKVISKIPLASGATFTVATSFQPETFKKGASIACNGCCLTVVDFAAVQVNDIVFSENFNTLFRVDVSEETFDRTTLSDWQVGYKVNLERSLRVGDTLDGHFVYGHIDATSSILSISGKGASRSFTFDIPHGLAFGIVPKGSIALDGVSLTVNQVENDFFTVNIIPETFRVTLFHTYKVGDRVNLEIDPFARYGARFSKS